MMPATSKIFSKIDTMRSVTKINIQFTAQICTIGISVICGATDCMIPIGTHRAGEYGKHAMQREEKVAEIMRTKTQ